jgi:hypothetical protein
MMVNLCCRSSTGPAFLQIVGRAAIAWRQWLNDAVLLHREQNPWPHPDRAVLDDQRAGVFARPVGRALRICSLHGNASRQTKRKPPAWARRLSEGGGVGRSGYPLFADPDPINWDVVAAGPGQPQVVGIAQYNVDDSRDQRGDNRRNRIRT